MRRFKLIIEYDGTNFCGWQYQKNAISIQELIEKSIFNLSGEKVTIHAAGRTDAGVHALGQVIHFDIKSSKFSAFSILNGMNHYLRHNKIIILRAEEVNKDFHARFSAKKRYYQYIIINRQSPLTIKKNLALHVKEPLNIEKMIEASAYLVGQHDFTSFRASSCQASTPIKTLDEIEILQLNDKITINFKAQSFLHHMIRNIVGTLRMVGNKQITPLDLKYILEKKDRSIAGPTALACGLYFMKVDYF